MKAIIAVFFFSQRRSAAQNRRVLPEQRRAPAYCTQQSGEEREKREKERDPDREGDERRREREDEMREISERIATKVAVRRRGEADARSVKGQKKRMTIAAETRERERVQRRRDEEGD